MAFGLDYVSGPPIAAMLAAKVAFVCRYTGYFSGYDISHPERPQAKCLTPGEAKALSEAGIAVVSNWEWSADRAVQGYGAGVWDGVTASKIHLACGGPESRPIYFSVDEQVDGAKVAAYFQGVASVLGLPRTGAYGSDLVLKYLFDHDLITWGWQTYAWSGGVWEPRAHIEQYSNNEKLGGASVDFNRSLQNDIGGWFYGVASPHVIPQEETVTPLTINDVKPYFTANADGSWTRVDPKTGVAFLDSAAKPIILKGEMKNDWCNHGADALPDIGLPIDNETQVDPAAHPEIVDQQFERCIRRFDPHHVKDSPPGAGPVYSIHLESLYKSSPLSAYIAAVKAVKGIVDPLAV